MQESTTNVCNILSISSDSEDSVVDALDDLADASLNVGLLPDVSDVLAALSDDDARILGADEGTERKDLGGRWRGFARVGSLGVC